MSIPKHLDTFTERTHKNKYSARALVTAKSKSKTSEKFFSMFHGSFVGNFTRITNLVSELDYLEK